MRYFFGTWLEDSAKIASCANGSKPEKLLHSHGHCHIHRHVHTHVHVSHASASDSIVQSAHRSARDDMKIAILP